LIRKKAGFVFLFPRCKEYYQEHQQAPDAPRWRHLAKMFEANGIVLEKLHKSVRDRPFAFAINDLVRCSVTCPSAKGLLAAFGRLTAADTEHITVVAAKNGFRKGATPSPSGYRDLKLIARFETGDVDWGAVVDCNTAGVCEFVAAVLDITEADVSGKRFPAATAFDATTSAGVAWGSRCRRLALWAPRGVCATRTSVVAAAAGGAAGPGA